MPDRSLKNCRVLVVEDEYILAQELEIELQDAGAIVVGPVADLADAVALIQADDGIDAAILDANLGGNMVFPPPNCLSNGRCRSCSRPATTHRPFRAGSAKWRDATSRSA